MQFVESGGLSLLTDVIFRPLPDNPRGVLGQEKLVTTRAWGVSEENARPSDQVHVFLARSPQHAEKLRSAGWYPVVIHGRPIHKPFVDHLDFGRLLGYPPCGVRFFETSNNWERTNTYAESWQNTVGAPDYRANCFGKLRNFSLIFHMPCRFDCPRTVRFARNLEAWIEREEPEYAADCRELLRRPVLALSERDVVLFEGTAHGRNALEYSDVVDLAHTDRERIRLLRKGDRLEVRGRFVTVLSHGSMVGVIECRVDHFLPEVPILLNRWSP